MSRPIFLVFPVVLVLGLCFLSETHGLHISGRNLESQLTGNWDRFVKSLLESSESASLEKRNEDKNYKLAPSGVPIKHYDHPEMGVPMDDCDNGKDHLDVDWNNSPTDYTCYNKKTPIPIRQDVQPVEDCDTFPDYYRPDHVCMQTEITYKSVLPTHELHRPLWPVYGEYEYVPPQRWLHSVEHGAIVMQYHPCAEPGMINVLKSILKGCLKRHIISPNIHLSKTRPLALVAWGCRLQMNTVNNETVVKFIKERALKGPEKLWGNGQYNLSLLVKAEIPMGSDYTDKVLCPNYD